MRGEYNTENSIQIEKYYLCTLLPFFQWVTAILFKVNRTLVTHDITGGAFHEWQPSPYPRNSQRAQRQGI